MSMEDNHNSSPKSVKVCEKILSAVTSSPVYRTLHRISSRQEHPTAASPAPNPSKLIHTPSTTATTIDIPITTPTSHEHPKSSKGSQHLDAVKVPIEFDFSSPPKLNVEGKPATPKPNDEDRFSEFITITKMKMLNGIDDDDQDKKKEKIDTDQEYIDRTKMKIRATTPSMSNGRR
ncbi:hypothetical protein I3843_07G093600 [Carya illinoinensis]|nr:hypothetical protein I3760_07G094300 [Carya illinoinensis]KAG7970614.1 hypothetical protein I3843_07G093600 [Carya illinoinensis]